MKRLSEYISVLEKIKETYGDIELYLEKKIDEENCDRAENLEVLQNDEFYKNLYGVQTSHFVTASF